MRSTTILAAALMSTALVASPALAQERTEAGVLTCNVAGGTGLVFSSSKQLTCTYDSFYGMASELYVGRIQKFGLDIGTTSEGVVAWGVVAPTRQLGPWALAGEYAGVGAEATIAVGGGANAMVGGSQNTIVLQPLSVSGQTGLNLAAGVSAIELVPAS